jgi:replicative DNA helicase
MRADLQLPPHNATAEAALIGAMLLDPETIDEVEPVVTPDDFYRDDHGDLARVLLTLRAEGRRTDAISVIAGLERRGVKPRDGGDWGDAISEMMRQVPHVANAVYHAQIVAQHARRRAVIEAANAMLKDAYGLEHDADEVTERAAARIYAIEERGASANPSEPIGVGVDEADARMERRVGGAMSGVPTGLDELDAMLDGLQPGTLNILAARPSVGKSLLGLQFARHAAMEVGIGAVFFSLEMPKRDLAARAITGVGRIDSQRARTGDLSRAERIAWKNACAKLKGCDRLFINDVRGRLTPERVVAEARRLKRRHGIGLVVIDYLQLMAPPADAERRAPRHEHVAAISGRLQQASKALDVPILLLAQLNRESEKREDRTPRAADLRESGAIEQDADVILLMHRPGMHDKTTPLSKLSLLVAKNRNGPQGLLEFNVDLPCGVVEPFCPPPANANGAPF